MKTLSSPWMLFLFGLGLGAVLVAVALGQRGEAPSGPPVGAGVPASAEDGPPALGRALALIGGQGEPEMPSAQAHEEDASASAAPDPETSGAAPLDARIQVLESQLASLQNRLVGVEGALDRALAARAMPDADASSAERPTPPRTQVERRDALVAAGVAPGVAEDLLFREAERSLERLALRDQAIREGWIGSDRFREELASIEADARPLRDEIGETSYDRYLYATGENNRVAVASIIPGSVAESAGFEPGDVIERYGEQRPFSFGELRRMTSEGTFGELVPVLVRRGTSQVEVWVPRGPLGITLDAARVAP